MSPLIPYSLQKIWNHPAHRSLSGLPALIAPLSRSCAWGGYQLQKQLKLFPAEGRIIPWVDDLKVQLLSSSQQSQTCLYYGLGDWPSMQFLRRYLRLGDLCADIGANVGTYTLLLAQRSGARNVHAFECLPSNIAKLQTNLRLNSFQEVTVHNIALADCNGTVSLNYNDGDSTASISPSSETQTSLLIAAKRFDSFVWSDRFAYIKIDVEGAEQLVLAGSEKLLESQPPMVWSFEYLDTQQRLGSSKAELLEAFARWNYHFYLYRPEENRLIPFLPDTSGVYPTRQDDNVLAIHSTAFNTVAQRLCGLT
ncbi:FkbM family methyltransferase [Synechococcus elongatus IITB4]|uniref:FkbM family methyltransferase n=1 Tax=Synechococcus elongatus TaxID=32046 RepID=UPI0030D397B4